MMRIVHPLPLFLFVIACAQRTSPTSGLEPAASLGDLEASDEAALCAWAQQRIEPFEEARPHSCWGWGDDGGGGGSLPGTWELRPAFERIDSEWICRELLPSFSGRTVQAFERCINTIRAYPEGVREEQRRGALELERCESEAPGWCPDYAARPYCSFARFDTDAFLNPELPTHALLIDCYVGLP